jgi:potassium/hydrogen antiporter
MDRRIDRRIVRRFLPVLLTALALGCDVDPSGRYLVVIAVLFLLGAGGESLFAKTRIPDVVWLIFAGVVLRVTGVIDPAILDPILPLFSILTLIVVLFEGGRQLVIHDILEAGPRASLLALSSFVLASLGVAVVVQLAALTGLLPDAWSFSHSLMVGALLGGSSAVVMKPSLLLGRVEPRITNFIALESALTDALCIVVAVVMMDLIASDGSGGLLLLLGKNFGLALGLGLIAGWAWMPVLRGLSGSRHAYPITLAALLILTVIVSSIGGNAPVAVLTFSIVVGNAEPLMKMFGFSLGDRPLRLDDSVITIHSQITFIIKSFFFTYMGLMLTPPLSLLLVGLVVGFALLGLRIATVRLVARKPAYDRSERKLLAIAVPRGMAAGVLATLAITRGIAGTEELGSLVFAAVVTSIVIFTVGVRGAIAEIDKPSPTVQPVEAPPVAVAPAPAPEPAPEAAKSHGTLYGVAPAPSVPAPTSNESKTPTSPGIPLVTLMGLPAVPGGPPQPEARPGMGGSFVPSRPSNEPDPLFKPRPDPLADQVAAPGDAGSDPDAAAGRSKVDEP